MPVYLIHFEERFKHAGHYIGWAKNVDARIAHHRKGSGANLMRVVNEAGIAWRVAKVWDEGDKTFERKLKNRGGASRICPICKQAHDLSRLPLFAGRPINADELPADLFVEEFKDAPF